MAACGFALVLGFGHEVAVALGPEQIVEGLHGGEGDVLLGAIDFGDGALLFDGSEPQGRADLSLGEQRLFDGDGVVENVHGGGHQGVAQLLGKLVEPGGVEEAGVAPAHGVGDDLDVGVGLGLDFADFAVEHFGRGAGFADVLVPGQSEADGFIERQGELLRRAKDTEDERREE